MNLLFLLFLFTGILFLFGLDSFLNPLSISPIQDQAVDTIRCRHCGEVVAKNPRCPNQTYCGKPGCRRARRNQWQKEKLQSDNDYQANQKRCQKQWRENHPDYIKQYRNTHPEKAEHNRMLQRVRNKGLHRQKKQVQPSVSSKPIAKMDPLFSPENGISGYYWLIPKIAKMDPFPVYLTEIVADTLHTSIVRPEL